MNVIVAWLRLDLRRRWKSLLVLAVLIGLAGGTVMASLAGARRGASAAQRLIARTEPATVDVLANTPGFDWRPIAKLPNVEALTTFIVDYAWSVEGIHGDPGSFPPADANTMITIEKPVVYSGRVFDPASSDEVVVTRQFVSHWHKGVGDKLVVDLAAPSELGSDSPPTGGFHGPKVVVHIVGVVSSPWFSDSPGGTGSLVLSPGIVAKYPLNTLGDVHSPDNSQFVNALIRLRGGESAIPQFRKDFAKATGRSDVFIGDLPGDLHDQAQREITFESRSLVAFAVAAFLAALVLIGQAIARYAAASTTELQTLRAVGMTPRQAVAVAASGPMIAGLVGALISAVAAYVASTWFPIGTASLLEPKPGREVDWLVFAPSVVAICLLVTAGAAGAGWLATVAARRPSASRRSLIATAARRSGLPVPITVGTRFALEAGKGKTSVPVRPALVGAVVGVLGIVAAFTFSHGVSDAASHPERFGQTFHAVGFVGLNNQDFGSDAHLIAALREQSTVTGIDDAKIGVATGHGGQSSVSLYTAPTGAKPLPVVLTAGRMPETASEVTLAPRSLTALHARIGAQVALAGSRTTRQFTVVGTALVPAGPHNTYADGGWVTPTGYDSLFTGFKFHIVLVALAPDARGSGGADALTAAVVKNHKDLAGLSFGPPDPILEVAELEQVRVLPIVLGVFLALLAVGAVGHAVATAVRRRSHDLAVLRALGLTQWQCRWVVITQASVLALLGLAVGVPVGLAIGRSIWRGVADYTPLQYVAPFAVGVMVLVAPASFVIANLLAAWPGRRAARLHIAHILRTE